MRTREHENMREARLASLAAKCTIRDALLQLREEQVIKASEKGKPRKGQQFWDWYKKKMAARDAALVPIKRDRDVLQSRRARIRKARRLINPT